MFSQAAHDDGSSLDQTSSAEAALQQAKLEEVLGLLLSAGYFRARAPGLAPFDKVRETGAVHFGVSCIGRCWFATGNWRDVLGNLQQWQ